MVGFSSKKTFTIAYDDIVDFQLIEDGGAVRRGELSGAFVGDMLFDDWEGAWLGAVIGGYDQAFCKRLDIDVFTNDFAASTIHIHLLAGKTDCGSSMFRSAAEDANRLMWKLDSIIEGW